MPGFMQGSHQALGEILGYVPRGQANIIGNAAGKGMMTDVQTPMIEIEPQRHHEIMTNLFLGFNGKWSFW